jgi:hypothetical protein
MYRIWTPIMTLVLGATFYVCSYAQQNGSIIGTVTDPSGAVVPGAKVTATNTATGRAQSTLTGASGTFSIPQVAPGTYTVTVEKSGFQRYVSSGVVVSVATASDLPTIALRVGVTTQTVNVTAAPALLQSSTTSTGAIIPPQALLDLPLELSGGIRDNLQFVTLTPGSQWTPGNDFTLRIGGGQVVGESMLLDGSETMSEQENGPSFGAVSPDAVEEFKVQTGTYSAQYSRLANGIVNFVTKSGTNQLHGDLYEYLENTALNARGFFAATTPVTHMNDFGGTVGGPIYIPHVYNGRNKAFWFFSYERSPYVAGVEPSLISVPSMAERNGDFSDWVTPTGAQIPIYDPATTAIVNGQVVRQQFPGNIIPAGDIVPEAAAVTSLVPEPTMPGIQDNLYSVGNSGSTHQTISFQIDLSPTAKDHTQFFFSQADESGLSSIGPLPGPMGSNFYSNQYAHYYRFNYDHIFSPTLMNHLSMGLNRLTNPQGANQQPSPAEREAISLKGVYDNALFETPVYSVEDFAQMGSGVVAGYPQQMVDINDMLTDIHGPHTLEAGFEFMTGYFSKIDNTYDAGYASFGSGQTGLPEVTTETGSGYASMLLGQAASGSYLFPGATQTGENYEAWFFQDDLKATKKLTLNMGIRYELPYPPTEKYARQSGFCATCSNPAAGGIPGAVTFLGTGPGRDGQSAFQTVRKDAFGPRLGVAYEVTPSTVLRGGGAIYYFPMREGANSDRCHDGFDDTTSTISSPNGYDPAFTLASGFPYSPPPPDFNPSIDNFGDPCLFMPGTGQAPYFITFNGTVEHRFGRSTTLTVSYAGDNGVLLDEWLIDYDQLNPRYQSLGSELSLPATSAAGLAALASVGKSLPWSTFPSDESVAQALLPWPQYVGFDPVERGSNGAHSTYNALEVGLSHPFSHGLWAQISYTYSKMLDNWGGLISYAVGQGQPGLQNSYDLASAKAVDNEDVPQHIVLSYVYDLPVGPGRHFLSGAKGITNAILGGWRLSGVQTYQSGWPLNVSSTQSNGVGTTEYANVNVKLPLKNPAWNGTPQVPYLNPAAFSRPVEYTFGNSPRFFSNLRAPALLDEDWSLAKDFALGENRTLTFQCNWFNALNRVQFGIPVTTVEDTDFGDVTSQANAAREIQFMLRLQF